jgi:hypothetical protein
MPDKYGYKTTLRICNNYCFPTATFVARKRFNVTLYVLSPYLGMSTLVVSSIVLSTLLLINLSLLIRFSPSQQENMFRSHANILYVCPTAKLHLICLYSPLHQFRHGTRRPSFLCQLNPLAVTTARPISIFNSHFLFSKYLLSYHC